MFIRTLPLVLALTLSAQKPPPSVDEVRAEARALLQSICGWQCDIVDVAIKTKPAAPVGAVAPGFDDAPAQRQIPSAIELGLLLDAKLTPQFRTFVSERVRGRIAETGLPVTVHAQVIPFPDRPAPPTEPEPAPPPAPTGPQIQPPAPIVLQAPPAPLSPPADEPDLWRTLVLRLIEALPLLLLALLLTWTVLKVLQRYESFFNAPAPDEERRTESKAEPRAEVPAATLLPPPRVDELTAQLKGERARTVRVFRALILRGDDEAVAQAVAALGDFVLKDLAHDLLVRTALGPLSRRTAEILSSPIDEAARGEVLRRVQAELIADRIAHPSETLRPELEHLLGLGPDSFAALLGRLDGRSRLVLLKHAPAELGEAYLRGLAPREHLELARTMLMTPAAEPSEIVSVARVIQSEIDAARLSGAEADRIVDLLDTLPAAEQDRLVETLEASRPDFVRRHAGQLPVESALLRVSEAAIAQAFAEVPVEEWIAYLRSAPETIRARSLSACPKRLEPSVREELSLRVAADPARALEARRRIVRAALGASATAGNGAAHRPLAVEERPAQNERRSREVKR